jgi:hypothetical protein
MRRRKVLFRWALARARDISQAVLGCAGAHGPQGYAVQDTNSADEEFGVIEGNNGVHDISGRHEDRFRTPRIG